MLAVKGDQIVPRSGQQHFNISCRFMYTFITPFRNKERHCDEPCGRGSECFHSSSANYKRRLMRLR